MDLHCYPIEDSNKIFQSVVNAIDIQNRFQFRRFVSTLKFPDIRGGINASDESTPSAEPTGKWWRHLVAGGTAGVISRTVTAPLDRVKVFVQVQTCNQKMLECFNGMIKEGGFRSLWRGNGMNVLKIGPESAIKFATYEQFKRFIKGDSKENLTVYERFIAGALAGAISQSSIYPFEVLKTRLALRKTGQYSSMVDAAIKIYKREGFHSFYRGYLPNILGIIPYAGIELAMYETLKKKYLMSAHSSKEEPNVYILLACSGASCTLGLLCTYPLALIKTKLQAKTTKPSAVSMTEVIKEVIRTAGVRGLYRGLTPNLIKVIPSVCIGFVVYEYSSRLLGVRMT
ncbi:hypothetical protein WA026_016433 [Henosepilachna vigintioctopunctata]|uniref:Calcium-binding mitochondrial carrier protein SCaMC-2 n=1 Tax=Henosepilachna vigintioctopunctata TaxID=420089 RepID=A0AAW1UL84_9CUCU